MTRGSRFIRWAVGASLVTACFVAEGRMRPQSPAPDWTDRLEALSPALPMAYFELAEEIADVAEDESQRALARRLFALAGLLDRDGLGRSACVALADMAEDELHRRRLLALASLLGGGGIGQAASAPLGAGMGEAPDPAAVLALTEAFSYYRRGRGPQAMAALRTPGAMELLTSCEQYLRGGADRFLEECGRYRGQLRPGLSDGDEVRMLRLEVALLAGAERPWSSDLLYGRGQPLIEVDPDRLEETFGVDASRPLYCAGRWVEWEP
jgi:hypothetical protein